MDDKRKLMEEKAALLNRAAKAYYQEDREIISNVEYDRIYDELLELEKETGIVLAQSPTAKVGYEAVDSLPKEKHPEPMLSLDKTKDTSALKEWLGDKVKTPVIPKDFYSSWAQYTIQLVDRETRDALQAVLKEAGIPSMVYYPKPMHRQEAFSDQPYDDADFPNTIKLCDTVLSLPMHPYLRDEDIDLVVEKIKCELK